MVSVIRPHKHSCKNHSEWCFPPGKPPEPLPQYYQFACDFRTPLMLFLNDVHRSEPIYLCGKHAAEVGRSTSVSPGGIQSSESSSFRISSEGPVAGSNSALDAKKGRPYLYILLLVGGLALAGGLLGPGLFRRVTRRSAKPAVTAEVQKRMASSTLPQKAPQKVQAALPQERSQPLFERHSQLHNRPNPVAKVAVKGAIARQVLPDVPKSASNTIRGTIFVSVKVQVDASGNVERTELLFPGPSRYFARLAVESARRWKFIPPVVAGQDSQSEWVIRFYFTREATRAVATEVLGPARRRK